MPNTTPTDFYEEWEELGAKWEKIGDQNSDPQRSNKQANGKCGDQRSDPSKAATRKGQQSRQLQIWRLELTCKLTRRQAQQTSLEDCWMH